MASINAFNKILDHQEREKNIAHKDYQHSVEEFETVAEQLYQLLQKKEQVEQEYNYYLKSSGTVTTLATHYAFIEQIKKKIDNVQVEVNKKRSIMDRKQQKLTKAHIEVKKFEKIIDHKIEHEHEKLKYHENKEMDEISSRQYFNRGNR
ncbi:flagellar FliJ protein [Pelagirhabdus alkalitolerans]|uniref:Flagellar FliJ protein n=1 Tax=Pelagirhabdus alkalitolerans TaxID=1612202 RepID=A0A1G6H3E6_9BACI|nr:flagellar export protein FliJ [Pelagirhabdus alkalitolerans]SDB88648.1 flagellar FliJ protein [Pelagirhabdus alkalitolerans]